ncbi:hypothetical protein HanRHA438_Chr08g0330801 [Helianthus annuus]|nr:hypothetical protein HanRHA438_Chr08g0330801 [Helianthus annuus]
MHFASWLHERYIRIIRTSSQIPLTYLILKLPIIQLNLDLYYLFFVLLMTHPDRLPAFSRAFFHDSTLFGFFLLCLEK